MILRHPAPAVEVESPACWPVIEKRIGKLERRAACNVEAVENAAGWPWLKRVFVETAV